MPRERGVRYVFGLPGEEILDILDSLLGSPITFLYPDPALGALLEGVPIRQTA